MTKVFAVSRIDVVMTFDFNAAKERSRLYSLTRKFFDERGYLEVETPVLSPDLIPESTIDSFSTTFINEFRGSSQLFMVPSPEVFIKKLIAAGSGSVYEISKCFRNCEQIGSIHNPEFTMLEYYTMDFDEKDSIGLTLDYLRSLSLDRPCIQMTVREAVFKYTRLDLDLLQNPALLRKEAVEKLGLHIPGPESWDDTFNRIFCTFVETAIPKDSIVIFTDYPHQIKCLAERSGNYRRRWEMYIDGIEIANCYLEETDPEEVRSYYGEEAAKLASERSATERVIPDSDNEYYRYFENFPKCSGVAIGMDRLLMVLIGASDIRQTLLFPFN